MYHQMLAFSVMITLKGMDSNLYKTDDGGKTFAKGNA